MTPKKYPQTLNTPKNIHFSENPKKYWNSEFWTQKNGPSLRMCENIRVPPPPPPGLLLPLFVGLLCLVLVCYSVLCVRLVLQSFWWGRESWLLCELSSLCLVTVSVFVALPNGAVGWSAVCDCGISWSCSATCFLAVLCWFYQGYSIPGFKDVLRLFFYILY